MAYLLAGPFVALIGIGAVFFVLRRKSVEKRSMYSARRSQIEHKVRAARQRTMTPHGRGPKPAEETIPSAGATTFAQTQAPQPTVVWEKPAYEAPPVAPPSAPVREQPAEAPSPAPWDLPAAAPAPAPAFDYPPAPPQPAYTPPAPEPFRPAPAPTPMPAPSEPAWTPAPAPAVEPAKQMEPVASTASATSAGAWSVVSTAKESAEPERDGKKKKDRAADGTSEWQLASGDAPGMEADQPEMKRSSGTVMAVAQYAVLVVGLVMVLIGVLVMVANSHFT